MVTVIAKIQIYVDVGVSMWGTSFGVLRSVLYWMQIPISKGISNKAKTRVLPKLSGIVCKWDVKMPETEHIHYLVVNCFVLVHVGSKTPRQRQHLSSWEGFRQAEYPSRCKSTVTEWAEIFTTICSLAWLWFLFELQLFNKRCNIYRFQCPGQHLNAGDRHILCLKAS